MNTKIIEKEKLALLNMATTIKEVAKTNKQNEKLIDTKYWMNAHLALYSQAADLAIKIMLQELGVKATKKRIQIVYKQLTEGNFHRPVEAVLDIKEEITWVDYPMVIWFPNTTTLTQYYLDEVKNILNDCVLVKNP
ncbi:hypothetical protein EGO58_06120 [Limosilactobacillus reuteri]|uniref:hypothetical protein n=1 Tax=Limosilactobacillus reuteri TaxID=1598 RepID=UPI000F4F8657|nr:hypothetical protein [Limosilactobacillus reuteri]MDZ5438288.1 hypothetical protein [Limosilactobacillus reuteri]ROV63070.1 hypothetical protein EGO58_06120 [Limosilactobacillus reuteri]UFK69159.1 hypothetical protein IVR12_02270 [Limosilactobacillus reuteri]